MKKVIVIDSETTGLNAKQDEILQLTILSDKGETLFNEYIRPVKRTEWPEAEKIHHISYDMVKDCAPIAYYKKIIQKLLDSADVIVGYNHSFDLSFLENAGIHSDPKKNYDIMLEFSQIKGDWDNTRNSYKWYKLKECADYFGYDWADESTHDSFADCKATLFCYHKILAGETKEGGTKNRSQHRSAFRSMNLSSPKWLGKILVLPLLALVIIGTTLALRHDPQKPPKQYRTTITKSSLQQVLDISELSTVEYRYGSVTQAVNKKGKPVYYVSYNGTVELGIDFSEIANSISIDTKQKIITVSIPEPKITSTNVNVDTLDYIFIDEKLNKAGLADEALKLCSDDLKNELQQNDKIYEIAKENAVNAIKQLLEPLSRQPDGEYTIVVR